MTDAVVLHGLSKTYGAIKAVDTIDLTVPTGLVYGFLGPNGAGKARDGEPGVGHGVVRVVGVAAHP